MTSRAYIINYFPQNYRQNVSHVVWFRYSLRCDTFMKRKDGFFTDAHYTRLGPASIRCPGSNAPR